VASVKMCMIENLKINVPIQSNLDVHTKVDLNIFIQGGTLYLLDL